jgi:hypothetical protein
MGREPPGEQLGNKLLLVRGHEPLTPVSGTEGTALGRSCGAVPSTSDRTDPRGGYAARVRLAEAPQLEAVDRVGSVSVVPPKLDDWDPPSRVSRFTERLPLVELSPDDPCAALEQDVLEGAGRLAGDVLQDQDVHAGLGSAG